jgi:predicted small integral membrane protein
MTSFTPARFADHEDVRGLGPVLRGAASVLVLMTAAYYLLVAFDNITNPASNWAFVHGVLSEDGVVPDSGFQWRAIDATWFQVAGYVVIILIETLTGAVLLYAGSRGLRSLRGAAGWAAAQRWTFVGTTAGLAVFFLGFITVGGNWFVMYLNSKFNGLDPAFQNAVMTLLTAVFVLGVLIADRISALPYGSGDQSATLT